MSAMRDFKEEGYCSVSLSQATKPTEDVGHDRNPPALSPRYMGIIQSSEGQEGKTKMKN